METAVDLVYKWSQNYLLCGKLNFDMCDMHIYVCSKVPIIDMM